MRLIYEKGVNGIDGTLNAKYYREFAGADAEVADIPTDDLADGSFVICSSGIVQFFDEASGQFNPMFTLKGEIPESAASLNSKMSASQGLLGGMRRATPTTEESVENENEAETEDEPQESVETEPEEEGGEEPAPEQEPEAEPVESAEEEPEIKPEPTPEEEEPDEESPEQTER